MDLEGRDGTVVIVIAAALTCANDTGDRRSLTPHVRTVLLAALAEVVGHRASRIERADDEVGLVTVVEVHGVTGCLALLRGISVEELQVGSLVAVSFAQPSVRHLNLARGVVPRSVQAGCIRGRRLQNWWEGPRGRGGRAAFHVTDGDGGRHFIRTIDDHARRAGSVHLVVDTTGDGLGFAVDRHRRGAPAGPTGLEVVPRQGDLKPAV